MDKPVVTAPTPLPAEAPGPRTLDVRLAPTRDEAGKIVAIDVAMRFSVPPVDFGDAGPIVLRLDPHATNAERIDDLMGRDSEGSLPLRRVTEVEAGKPAPAEWRSERRARGPVMVNYRYELPSTDAAAEDIAVSAGGVLGIGRAIFLLPATTEAHTIRVRWDLQGLGEGAQGSSTFGAEVSEIEGAPAKLTGAIWAAGALDELAVRSPVTTAGGSARFRLISLGRGSFDVLEAGPWANRMWLAARTVGTEAPAPNFDLFIRSTGKTGPRFDVNVFGLGAIAVVDQGAQFGWPEKLALARAFIRAAHGTSNAHVRWFDDGFVTYYALETLRKSGLGKPDELGAELAKRSERYFGSPWLRTPMVDLAKQVDAGSLEHAEDRGFLYATEMDGKIRVRTFGKKSLEDVWRLAAAKPDNAEDGAGAMNATSFATALEKEMGPDALSRLSDVVFDGDSTATVADDAFGPCFKKVKKKVQRENAGDKKRETVDGFTWTVVPKLPANCGAVMQVGGEPKKL